MQQFLYRKLAHSGLAKVTFSLGTSMIRYRTFHTSVRVLLLPIYGFHMSIRFPNYEVFNLPSVEHEMFFGLTQDISSKFHFTSPPFMPFDLLTAALLCCNGLWMSPFLCLYICSTSIICSTSTHTKSAANENVKFFKIFHLLVTSAFPKIRSTKAVDYKIQKY